MWKLVVNEFSDDDGKWKAALKVAGAVAGVGLAGYGVYYIGTKVVKSQSTTNTPPMEPAVDTPEKKLEVATRFKEEGNKLFMTSKYEEAKKLYTDAIEACPSDAPKVLAVFYQNRAATSDAMEQWESVIIDCDEALLRDHRYQKAYSRRGKAKLALSRYDDAVLDTASGYYLQSSRQTKQNLQLFMQAVSESARVACAKLMQSRTEPLNFGLEVINSYVANSPSDPVMSKLEEYAKEAARPFHKACQKMLAAAPSSSILADLDEELAQSDSPYYPEALLLRATVYSIGGCPDRAEKDLDTLISMDQLSDRFRSSVLLRRGLHHVTTDVAMGLADLDKAAEADKTNPDVYHQRAQIFMLMQRLHQAKEDFSTAHDLHIKATGTYNIHVFIHKLACDLHSQQGDVMSLLEEMEKLCKKHPEVAELWLIYGQMQIMLGRFIDADESYQTSLKHCPDNPKIYIQRAALMLTWKKDTKLAIDFLNKARELDKDCDAVYESLGAVLLQNGQVKEAVEIFHLQTKTSRTVVECQQAFCMLESARAQLYVAEKFELQNLANVFLSPMPPPV
ncbi:mitochondrial import receptor subunit TOM70-like [Watersipora subatra]|uniref:mitochondrial import receptor subunit TOM70-like n=1 Tax=Watersipora subatra TaxID=2589382 RepID=UPI00355C33FD